MNFLKRKKKTLQLYRSIIYQGFVSVSQGPPGPPGPPGIPGRILGLKGVSMNLIHTIRV